MQWLTAKDLMNYAYCKRIPYFEHVLQIPQKTTFKELNGRKAHMQFSEKSHRNKIISELPLLKKEYNVFLQSSALRYRTVLDCIAIDKENRQAFPIEAKNRMRTPRVYWGQKLQLIGEALLLQEATNCHVPCGYIKYLETGEWTKIQIFLADFEEFKETLQDIEKVLSKEEMPEPTQHLKKCRDCCFSRVCRRA